LWVVVRNPVKQVDREVEEHMEVGPVVDMQLVEQETLQQLPQAKAIVVADPHVMYKVNRHPVVAAGQVAQAETQHQFIMLVMVDAVSLLL
jgi:hypothetical protein